jgi:AcrR family transcriptional regulator
MTMTDALDAGLPRAVAVTWGMVADPQRGPKRELSHERIVEAAMAIADADGIGAVTMNKVAGALGFTTMALYRYVTSKDDLLELMQDAVAGEVLSGTDQGLADGRRGSGTVTPDWRQELRRFADQLRGAYRDHPWMGDLPMSEALLLTPNNLAVADLAMRAMRSLPLPEPEKVGVLLLITVFVRANSQMERDIASTGDRAQMQIAGELIKELVTDERFPDLAPMVRSRVYLPGDDPTAEADDDVVDYDYGLKIILDGIAFRAEHGSAPVSEATGASREEDRLADALSLDHVRKDPKVKDAIGKRREAEGRLRDARKREREMIKNALERGPKS